MRAFYSTQGETLRARGLPCDPESHDLDAPAVCEVTVSVLLSALRLNHADDVGFSLDHLRVLTGPVCDHCHSGDGLIVPGTEEQVDPWGYIHGHLCEACNDREPDHSDFYGGSGPSDQDRFEAARDSGRRP